MTVKYGTSITTSKCVSLLAGDCNVTFYDMDYNNVPYTTEYAVKLTNQLITGLFPSPASNTIPASISTVVTLPSSSCIVCTSSKSLYYCLYST